MDIFWDNGVYSWRNGDAIPFPQWTPGPRGVTMTPCWGMKHDETTTGTIEWGMG